MADTDYLQYKDKVFRLYRNDRDILVIPPKYVEELQNLPAETLSSSKAVYAVRRHSSPSKSQVRSQMIFMMLMF